MPRQRVLRKTKVIATLGPACDSRDAMRALVQAGMNVARLNFSHGTHEEHAARVEQVRSVAADLGVHVAVMLDTKGTEIRTGNIAEGTLLERGQPFALYTRDRPGDGEGVSITYPELARVIADGAPILIDDGRIELRVEKTEADAVRCVVVRGGELGSRKGLNVPETAVRLQGMSPQNVQDLLFATNHEIDYIAASHVQGAADVREIREILRMHGATIPIIAKIESRAGVENLRAIIEEADGTMVARGDLGVEMPVDRVPLIQKEIIRATVMSGKPVVTATQMLDSMERNPRPTRAEASDVANAILDGTSAVMLSGETAKGQYPTEAVETMASIAMQAEASLREYGDLQQILPHAAHVVTEAVAQAAITMAHHLEAAAILTLTESGYTSRSISKYRPDCPIFAVTSSLEVVRRLALNWGVTGMLYEGGGTDEDVVRFLIERARERDWLRTDDVVVVTAGISGRTGSTNLIRVVTVE